MATTISSNLIQSSTRHEPLAPRDIKAGTRLGIAEVPTKGADAEFRPIAIPLCMVVVVFTARQTPKGLAQSQDVWMLLPVPSVHCSFGSRISRRNLNP